jgi:uncharacterized membrane protein
MARPCSSTPARDGRHGFDGAAALADRRGVVSFGAMSTPATLPADVAASDPGAAVPKAAVIPMPKQEDRLMAAAAHLSFLTGFWLVAPIVFYIVKRKESRFVAFQALQSAILHVFWAASAVVSVFGFFTLMAVAGMSGHPAAGVIAIFAPFLFFGGGGLLVCGVHAYAAYEAWCGRSFTVPLAGRIAGAIMAADEGAIRA